LSFSETKEQIITGLANRNIVQGLFAKFHVDSDDLLHDIMDFERLCSAGDRDRRDRERERGVQNRSENPGNPKHETNPSPSPSSQLQSTKICFRCKEVGHFANSCPSRPQITCFTCNQPGHKSPECPQRRQPLVIQHVYSINDTSDTNLKYYKDAVVNGEVVKSYLDLGSTVCVMRDELVPKLNLMCDWSDKRKIVGYGGAVTMTLGTTNVHLEVDGVGADVNFYVVPRETQKIPLLVGHPFTEQPHIRIIKTKDEIRVEKDTTATVNSTPEKVVLWAKDASVIPENFLGHVVVRSNKINTDPCGEGGVRQIASMDCGLVSRCVVKTDEIGEAVLPELNISGKDVTVKEDSEMARGETCVDGTLCRKVNTVPVIVSEVDNGCRVHREEEEVLIRRVVPPQVPGQLRQAKTSIEQHQRRNRRRPRRPRRQQGRPGRGQDGGLSGGGPVAQQSVRSHKTICVVDRVQDCKLFVGCNCIG
jgi:hypothetical protein